MCFMSIPTALGIRIEARLTPLAGRAVKVGNKVKDIKVGDRVGVGAQVGADLDCDNCKADQENYCPNQ
jgi:alcohol dehydrogenase (NADP+)